MKNMKNLLLTAIAIFGFSAISFGQATVSATANAEATIVTPLGIEKKIDLNFGNVAVNNTIGTVIITPLGVRSVTGGATLPAVTGTVTAASFDVIGDTDYGYSIKLPTTATTVKSGSNTMTVDTWSSNPTTTGKLTSGKQTLLVGATLNVGISQAAGKYTSDQNFTVTVCYN